MIRNNEFQKFEIEFIFIFSFSPYERQAIERAKEIKLGRTLVRFASFEDVVIHKVISGGPRDVEDVKSILLKNPRFNSAYIMRWLREFDQSLNQSLSEAFRKIKEELRS